MLYDSIFLGVVVLAIIACFVCAGFLTEIRGNIQGQKNKTTIAMTIGWIGGGLGLIIGLLNGYAGSGTTGNGIVRAFRHMGHIIVTILGLALFAIGIVTILARNTLKDARTWATNDNKYSGKLITVIAISFGTAGLCGFVSVHGGVMIYHNATPDDKPVQPGMVPQGTIAPADTVTPEPGVQGIKRDLATRYRNAQTRADAAKKPGTRDMYEKEAAQALGQLKNLMRMEKAGEQNAANAAMYDVMKANVAANRAYMPR